MKKKIVFLGQGKKNNILNFLNLSDNEHDLIVLTYDEEILNVGAEWQTIFAPGTTRAEGRNILLNLAKEKQPSGYDYYIFFDDDVIFLKGNFNDFTCRLLKDNPNFAISLCDIIEKSGRYDKLQIKQKPIAFDQVVQAYSRKAVDEAIAIPYVTDYDELSWWYSCEINQFLTLSLYNETCIQYNDIRLANGHHPVAGDNSSIYRGGQLRHQI